MKRIFFAMATAALILLTLCSCNSQNSALSAAESPQTSAVTEAQTTDTPSKVNADSDTISDFSAVLIGTWVNENDYTERYIFAYNLSFERYLGANKSEGVLTLGDNGTLNVTFSTEDIAVKTYQKTDSPTGTGEDGWYLDDGHFILGDTRLVKTVEY